MPAYLGPAANLVKFDGVNAEQIEVADRVSFSRTMGGVQTAQTTQRAPRSWQVGMSFVDASEVGMLLGLLEGAYGDQPWRFVSHWMQVSNMLPAASSMLLSGSWTGGGVHGGSVSLEGGHRPAFSVVNDSGSTMRLPAVPAVAGEHLTGSAWLVGSSTVNMYLDFRNASGSIIATSSAAHSAPAGGALPRRSVTGTAPAGAVDVVLRFQGALRVALPCISWTPDMGAWSPGEAAPKVVARGLSKNVLHAVRDQPNLRRIGVSFTLEEVGNA